MSTFNSYDSVINHPYYEDMSKRFDPPLTKEQIIRAISSLLAAMECDGETTDYGPSGINDTDRLEAILHTQRRDLDGLEN